EGLALADAREDVPRVLGDAAVELTAGVAEEAAVRRIGRLVGDARKLERFAVVEGRVAAAVRHRDRLFPRRFVAILSRQRPIEFGVVEHETRDPDYGRRVLGLLPDSRLDLANLPQVRVDAVALLDAARMAVRVDEAGHDRHALRVDDRGPRRREVAHVA